MERRDFFKTIFGTPLLAPFLLGSPDTAGGELFLISDSPQTYLPSLLAEKEIQDRTGGRRYAILDTHPTEAAISGALQASGWIKTTPHQGVDVSLSFRHLRHPVPPSFTLVREGRIVDIRKKELFSLWKEMNGRQPPSSCLTVAAFRMRRPSPASGTSVRVFHGGRIAGEVSLKKDRVQNFRTEQGKVTMKIEKGQVSIPSSSCRGKICCSARPVSRPGERIVCAPNHFLLEIRGPGTLDTIIG